MRLAKAVIHSPDEECYGDFKAAGYWRNQFDKALMDFLDL